MDWSRFSRRAMILMPALAAVFALAPIARAQVVEDPAARIIRIKQTARRMLMQGARSRIEDARAAEAWRRWKAKHPNAGARRARKADGTEFAPPRDFTPARVQPGARPFAVQGIPTNVRCNDPTGDAANAGQAEEYLARSGNNVLVAWNDGQGFNTGGDIQNYAYSTDGGATFIQPAGGIPHPAGVAGFVWSSDPSVALNEKTGRFYYAGLCDIGNTSNGLAVAQCSFPGGNAAPVWGTTTLVRSVASSSRIIDKEWVAVDSLSGRVFVTYTVFTAGEDSIEFQRSQDGGFSWGPVVICSSDSAAGWVQGSRVISGPGGEVYVTWNEIGQTTAFDHMRIRKSTNGGSGFGSEAEVCKEYANFGTGAPGFNRQLGITFPSIAVDRTQGLHRGRVYVAWNESVDWSNDPLGGGGSKNEIEPNDSPGAATAISIGQRLRGTVANTTDLDYFSFAATQGTNYIFWVDSLTASLEYTMRVFCSDGATSLALSGADANNPGTSGFIDWTCPVSGTYYLRIAYNGSVGGYRIETGTNGGNTGERSRDHRDVFVSYSDNGASWSTATRSNDDPPWFDNWLPEVAVGGDGFVYAAWYDWRDAAANCGGSSNVYVARSADGGMTWEASQPVTSAATAWSTVVSNIAPNEGDYIALRADGTHVMPSWADGRSGNPDVWATQFDTGFSLATCPNDSTVATSTTLPLQFQWTNNSGMYSNQYTYHLSDTAGWITDGPTTVATAAGATTSRTYNITVPDTTYNANDITFSVSNITGALVQQCHVHYTVTGRVGAPPVGYSFALNSPVPNPVTTTARIDFTLPKDGNVKLVIYGLDGRRVRTLLNGDMAAGPNSVTWDGLDDAGRRVHAGVYFYRLETPGFRGDRRMVFTP